MKLSQTDIFFQKISIKNQRIILSLLILFSVYCALIIGQTWDEGHRFLQGKITFNYLLSLGKLDEEIYLREYYSTLYWSLSYLISTIFPSKYSDQIIHLINLSFSIMTIFGISKICSEIFNKSIGKITFLILFFYPIFFGHMAINSSDTILAFGHVWITFFVIKYLKLQNSNKSGSYIFFIGIIAALSTGIQMVFLGSLIPIIFFIFLEIFFLKIFISKNFSKKKLFFDILKCFLIFYSILILFWIDAHPNIISLPFKILAQTFSDNYWTGYAYNLINGNYYFSNQIPGTYLLLNYIFKTPEYILLLYIIFIYIFLKKNTFYKKKIKFFNKKITLIISILLFPHLVVLLIPYPLYDGMRLFIWTIPYACIIPAIAIYYLLENFNQVFNKFLLLLNLSLLGFFLVNFFHITPYQYTYLNSLNGDVENRYQKFENDYWGASIKELVDSFNFKNKKTILIATCGLSDANLKKYLKEKKYTFFEFTEDKDAEYIVMTNRVTKKNDNLNSTNNLINCFDKYEGKNIFEVRRGNMIFSSFRKL